MNEIFIANDPRFLSGGRDCGFPANYDRPLTRLSNDDVTVTTEDVIRGIREDGIPHELPDALECIGQVIHNGRLPYHHRPNLNVFAREGENPTVGVELETVERHDISCEALEKDLVSNWFHFESDSSLTGDGRRGYELITEPLPPRIYRDMRLWTGLQNILTPWTESFESSLTGLHVHVGLEQFESLRGLEAFQTIQDRRTAGKLVSSAVYLCIADRAFLDSVFLRRNTSYCGDRSGDVFSAVSSAISTDGITAGRFVDLVLASAIKKEPNTWCSGVYLAKDFIMDSGCSSTFRFLSESLSCFTSHCTEINCEHPFTIEFRRGKGTLNAVSVHRMVELTTLIVKYAEHLIENRDDKVTLTSFAEYVIANTNSSALKQFAEKSKGN